MIIESVEADAQSVTVNVTIVGSILGRANELM